MALENTDKAVADFVEHLNQTVQAYDVAVYEAAVRAIFYQGAVEFIVGITLVLLILGLVYLRNILRKMKEEEEVSDDDMSMCSAGIGLLWILGFGFLCAFLGTTLNPWNWIRIFDPETMLVKEIMTSILR
jgi:uncharacterized membrane protein YciS (DUF1049 family)